MRLLGCISSAENERIARQNGFRSDRETIAGLAAPWDGTDTPVIINYDDNWKKKLEDEAEAFDVLRDSGELQPVWEIAKAYGYNLPSLRVSRQFINDCTACGETIAAICLALFQLRFGAEINVEEMNPDGVYAYSSGQRAVANAYVPDNGRTIYGIAEAACTVGNFPVSAIGKYQGNARFSQAMIDSYNVALQNEIGWVYLGDKYRSAEELADIVILSLRACRPVIIGNTIAMQDGTSLNKDGVYVADVRGNWGGGHCTAAVDVRKVGNTYYPFIYNSHGPIYRAGDGSPDEGAYVTRDGLIRYFSGSWTDVMLSTYVERPRTEYKDYKKTNG